MPVRNPSLGYTSEPAKIIPFKDKKAALNWLKKSKLDTNSTPILLPFYNKNKCVEFLNPGDSEDRLRIIGNGVIKGRNKNAFSRFRRNLTEKVTSKRFIPHMNKQEGSIPIATESDFLIVYLKDEKNTPAGNDFNQLILNTQEDLEKDIKSSPTNDATKINKAKLIEDLTLLGGKSSIIAGMCYFIKKDEEGNQTVYRHIFKAGTSDKKIRDFLEKEKIATLNNEKIATPVRIENNKTVKTHRIAFIKDFLAGLVVLGITAFAVASGITLCMLIIPFPINFIAAATTTAILLPSIPLIYKKALKKNKPTIEFAKTFTATPLTKAINKFTVTPVAKAIDKFKENMFSDDEVDSPATPNEPMGITRPCKKVSTVLVKSFFPNSRFINRLDSINEDEVDSALLDTPQESSIGIRHG